MNTTDYERYDWGHCIVCGAEMDDYDRQYGDGLSCGHNICAECLICGEAAEHVRGCKETPPNMQPD